MVLLELKACPRCRGAVCHRCQSVHKAGHCLQCGYVLYEVSVDIQAEFHSRLGRAFPKRGGRAYEAFGPDKDMSVELDEDGNADLERLRRAAG